MPEGMFGRERDVKGDEWMEEAFGEGMSGVMPEYRGDAGKGCGVCMGGLVAGTWVVQRRTSQQYMPKPFMG